MNILGYRVDLTKPIGHEERVIVEVGMRQDEVDTLRDFLRLDRKPDPESPMGEFAQKLDALLEMAKQQLLDKEGT